MSPTHALGHTMCGYPHHVPKYMLPQNHCGDNWESKLFLLLHIYFAHLAFVEFERSVRRGLHESFTCSLFFKIFQENNLLRKSYEDYFVDKFKRLLNKKI